MVQLIKGTSIASIIGFVELTRAGQLMTNVTFEPMVIYPVVAALYFAILLAPFGAQPNARETPRCRSWPYATSRQIRLETHPDCASRRVSSMMEAA